MSDGSVDITGLIDSLRNSFVVWATNYVLGLTIAVPGMQWVAFPFISSIYKYILTKIIGWIADNAVMEAFFLNTAMRKAGEATDYINAVNFKANMPPTASEAEYETAELQEIHAFNNFVVLSN